MCCLKRAIFHALQYYTLKRSPQGNKLQFISYNVWIDTVLRKSKRWRGDCSFLRASFRTKRVNVIGSFFLGLLRFVKTLLHSGAKAVGEEALKIYKSITTYILNKEPKQPVCNIFITRFSEAKGNL